MEPRNSDKQVEKILLEIEKLKERVKVAEAHTAALYQALYTWVGTDNKSMVDLIHRIAMGILSRGV